MSLQIGIESSIIKSRKYRPIGWFVRKISQKGRRLSFCLTYGDSISTSTERRYERKVHSRETKIRLNANLRKIIFSDLQDLAVLSRKLGLNPLLKGLDLPIEENIKTVSSRFWDKYICPGPCQESCAQCFDPEQSNPKCGCPFKKSCTSIRGTRKRNKPKLHEGYFCGRSVFVDVQRREILISNLAQISSLPPRSTNQICLQTSHIVQIWDREMRNTTAEFLRCPYLASLGRCDGTCKRCR